MARNELLTTENGENNLEFLRVLRGENTPTASKAHGRVTINSLLQDGGLVVKLGPVPNSVLKHENWGLLGIQAGQVDQGCNTIHPPLSVL